MQIRSLYQVEDLKIAAKTNWLIHHHKIWYRLVLPRPGTTGTFFLAQTWKHGAVNSRKKPAKNQHMKRITLERLTRELKAKLFSKGSENKSFFFLFFFGSKSSLKYTWFSSNYRFKSLNRNQIQLPLNPPNTRHVACCELNKCISDD